MRKKLYNRISSASTTVLVQQEKKMTACHGFGWDRDNFLCRCLYDAMF